MFTSQLCRPINISYKCFTLHSYLQQGFLALDLERRLEKVVLGQQGLLHLSAAQVGLPEVLAELERAVVVPLAGKGMFDCMDSVAAD